MKILVAVICLVAAHVEGKQTTQGRAIGFLGLPFWVEIGESFRELRDFLKDKHHEKQADLAIKAVFEKFVDLVKFCLNGLKQTPLVLIEAVRDFLNALLNIKRNHEQLLKDLVELVRKHLSVLVQYFRYLVKLPRDKAKGTYYEKQLTGIWDDLKEKHPNEIASFSKDLWALRKLPSGLYIRVAKSIYNGYFGFFKELRRTIAAQVDIIDKFAKTLPPHLAEKFFRVTGGIKEHVLDFILEEVDSDKYVWKDR